ncbi:TPA: hypothetical protein ACN33P_004836, partial [Vibrio parahaemolyticus]
YLESILNVEEKTRSRELSEGLLRQRRNLLVSSVAVFIFIALGFELTELRFLGNTAKVNNPLVVPILLMVAHLYFTLRYWQYYLEENPIPKVFDVLIKNIREYESKLLGEKAKLSLNSLFPFEHVNLSYPRYDRLTWGEAHELIPDKIINLVSKSICVHAQVYSEDRTTVFDTMEEEYTFKQKYSSQKEWVVIKITEDHWGNSQGVIIEGWVTCYRLSFFLFKVKALAKYIFVQSYFTDYQLPLVLSFVSLIFGCVSYLET